MEQIELFNESVSTIIPNDVISPLESKEKLRSKAFKEQQTKWSEFVKTIQITHDCSWFEARKLLIKHRDHQIPIKINIVQE